jgi:hypothetical protein
LLSNYSENNIHSKGSIFNLHSIANLKTPFVNKHANIFSLLIRIVGHLIVRIPSVEIGQTFVNIFMLDANFNNIVHIFLSNILNEILSICEAQDEIIAQSDFFTRHEDFCDDYDLTGDGQTGGVGPGNSIPTFNLAEQKLFLTAKYALDFFKSQLLFCKKLIYQEKLYERDSKGNESKKHWKSIVREILKIVAKMIEPNKGILCRFLNGNSVLNTVLAKHIHIDTLQKDHKLALNLNLRFNIYYTIFDFLMVAFSFPRQFSFL